MSTCSQKARKFSTFNEMEISPDEPQRRELGMTRCGSLDWGNREWNGEWVARAM